MLKKNKKTSIIVTSHNYGKYLKKCLDSLFNQSVKPLEIILINDSSSDNTKEVVEKYNQYEDFIYYEADFVSAQKSRNFGLEKAKGEYILNMDADNYLDENFLKETQNVLDDDKNISLAYTDHIVFGDDNLIAETAQGKHWMSKNFDYDALRQMNYIDTTSLVRKVNFSGFDERVRRFQDWDAWLTFLKNKKAYHIAKPLLFKRLHRASKTSLIQLYMERLRVMFKHNILVGRNSDKNSFKNYSSGKIFCMISATENNEKFLYKFLDKSKYKKIFVYIVDRGDQNCSGRIKNILKKRNIVYRLLRNYNIDKALKGFRMGNYMPAYSTDYLIIVNEIKNELTFCDNKNCDFIYAANCNLTECKTFDDISYVVFNKKGLSKFLNV